METKKKVIFAIVSFLMFSGVAVIALFMVDSSGLETHRTKQDISTMNAREPALDVKLPYVSVLTHDWFKEVHFEICKFCVDNGKHPSTDEGNRSLFLMGNYNYRFTEFPDKTYTIELHTYGKDGKKGGYGKNSDIAFRWRGDSTDGTCCSFGNNIETPYCTSGVGERSPERCPSPNNMIIEKRPNLKTGQADD